MGLQERYQMDPNMRPLYFGIRFAGIARTAEYDTINRPQEIAGEVARRAKMIQDKDRPGRRESFKKLGLPMDETVQ